MRFARGLGTLIQALVLGTVLFVAVAKLAALHSDARLFVYQSF